MLIEVFAAGKPNAIYTTELDVQRNGRMIRILRRGKVIGQSESETEAINRACETVLAGFKNPGVYTAWVDGEPYVNRAPGVQDIEAAWLASTSS